MKIPMPPVYRSKFRVAFPMQNSFSHVELFQSGGKAGYMNAVSMKPKGAVDRTSLSSINHIKTQGALTAHNLAVLNRPAVCGQQAVPANPGTPVRTIPAAQADPGTPLRTIPPAQAPVRPITAEPVKKPLPPFVRPIQKGQKAPIGSSAAPLTRIQACFGWNTINPQCDVDVSAFLLTADGRVPGDLWFVFYGQKTSPDQSCRLQTAHSQAPDRQAILIDLNKINTAVKKIVFVLTINDAFAKKLHFGMIRDAYVRILHNDRTEIISFKITDYYTNIISMMIGEIYQHNGTWKFNAVGNGVAKDLAGLCSLYGVQVSD